MDLNTGFGVDIPNESCSKCQNAQKNKHDGGVCWRQTEEFWPS